jgi:hypothetical protein
VQILDSLANALCVEVPKLVAERFPDTELCRLKLWYYDTSAPEYYFLAEPMRSTYRTELLQAKGQDALSYLWDNPDPGAKEFIIGDETSPSARAFEEVNQWRRAEKLAVADERLRQFACDVCLKLNALHWPKYLKVTDDFIVYAQNGTDYGVDNYKDLIESVPIAKIERLRDNQLFGPGAEYTKMQEFCSPERWCEVLDYAERMRHPKDCGTNG